MRGHEIKIPAGPGQPGQTQDGQAGATVRNVQRGAVRGAKTVQIDLAMSGLARIVDLLAGRTENIKESPKCAVRLHR